MFGESTGLVDNVPIDAPLGGNRKCTEQGVPVQRARVRSAWRSEMRQIVDLQLVNTFAIHSRGQVVR
jgi:hypothetical protein